MDGFGKQMSKERLKIDGSLSHWKVFIVAPMVIVQMNFSQTIPENINPGGQRRNWEKLCWWPTSRQNPQ